MARKRIEDERRHVAKCGTVATDATSVVVPDQDRLFANVDEFLFRPEMSGNTRAENKLISADRLRRARFFLTANSRAPGNPSVPSRDSGCRTGLAGNLSRPASTKSG